VVAGDSLELLSEFYFARRIFGWTSRSVDLANGGADGSFEIRKAGEIDRGAEECRAGGTMIPLLVDLEQEWRGGQNQFFLLLKGLY